MKLLKVSLTAAALAAAGSVATAADYFGIVPGVDAFDTKVELDTVRSSADGMIQIVDADGNVLGMTNVNAGANAEIVISLNGPAQAGLTAQILHNGASSPAVVADIPVDRF